jgi:hypothetical protein
MKKHTKIYMDFFGYDENSFIPCELCGAKAVDINHIIARGMGGDPKGSKDTIENLAACCRECHIQKGDKKQYRDEWITKHTEKVQARLRLQKSTIADDEQHEVTPEGKIIFKHEK